MNNDYRNITNQSLDGERPLFNAHDLNLDNLYIGEGESALKQTRRLNIKNSLFDGMYVIWETENINCIDSVFSSKARASMWYGKDIMFIHCKIDAPKAFREIKGLDILHCIINDGTEALWRCHDGRMEDSKMNNGQYAFFQSEKWLIRDCHLKGKYSFQYTKEIEIHNCIIDTKDAFWESDNCTVYDSEIKGEYLGWYSRNLRLVRCHISGTQPLCYCKNLQLEECTFDKSADRCFEFSNVTGSIIGDKVDMVPPFDIEQLQFIPNK